MRKLFLVLCLITMAASAGAQTIDYARDGFPPLVKQEEASADAKTAVKISNSALRKLEQKIFNRTYDNDPDENRIARLEEQIFGTIQTGDINTRYNTLSKAVPSYTRNKYSSASSSYCGMPAASTGWRGLAGSFTNPFSTSYSGYPTGLSPQIYSPYINNYGPDYQRGFYSNRGWNYHNTNYGTGSGVRIINY